MNFNFENLPLRKILTITIIVLYVVVIVFSIVSINKKPYAQLPEPIASSSITIKDSSNALYLAMVTEDYNTFLYRLQNYITFQGGDPGAEVIIKSIDIPEQEQTFYSVTLDIPSLNQTDVIANFDYATNTFSIPSKNYNTPFYQPES